MISEGNEKHPLLIYLNGDCSVRGVGGGGGEGGMERRDKETECRRGGTGSQRVRGEGEGGETYTGGMKRSREVLEDGVKMQTCVCVCVKNVEDKLKENFREKTVASSFTGDVLVLVSFSFVVFFMGKRLH